jgi:hypothetical protein
VAPVSSSTISLAPPRRASPSSRPFFSSANP